MELGKHLGELVIDLGVTLLDEDGYVKRFLRRERGEVAFHFVAPRRTTTVNSGYLFMDDFYMHRRRPEAEIPELEPGEAQKSAGLAIDAFDGGT